MSIRNPSITLREGEIPPAGYVFSRTLRGRNVYVIPKASRTRRRVSVDDLADMFGNMSTDASVKSRPVRVKAPKTRKRRTRRMDVETVLSPIQENIEIMTAPFYNTVRRRHMKHKTLRTRQSKARESKLWQARHRPVATGRKTEKYKGFKLGMDDSKRQKDARSRILSLKRGILP